MCIPLRAAGAVAPGFGGDMHCHVYRQRTCFSGPLLLCFLATLHLLVMPELLFGRVFLRLWSEGVCGLIPSRTTKCQYVLYPYCIPTQRIWSSGGKCSHKELKSLQKTPSIRQAGNCTMIHHRILLALLLLRIAIPWLKSSLWVTITTSKLDTIHNWLDLQCPVG